jgi:hypothetical protein
MLRGEVDISFRLKGSKGKLASVIPLPSELTCHTSGAGMLFFTSVRKARGEPFEIRASSLSYLFSFFKNSF